MKVNGKSRAALLALGLAGALGAAQAGVITVNDAVGDFVPTYTGPKNADLDVVEADSTWYQALHQFVFHARMAGAIGSTAGVTYIWGIDRGAGTERFIAGTPSTGAGVFFDAVVTATAAGAVSVNLLNGTTFTLASSALVINGDELTLTVDDSLLPGRGRSFGAYGWNLWPRSGGGNAAISDFAPDASTPVVGTVPEPAGLGLLAAGLVLLSRPGRLRRRSLPG